MLKQECGQLPDSVENDEPSARHDVPLLPTMTNGVWQRLPEPDSVQNDEPSARHDVPLLPTTTSGVWQRLPEPDSVQNDEPSARHDVPLLPTTTSGVWQRLPEPLLELMDEAMQFMDEDSHGMTSSSIQNDSDDEGHGTADSGAPNSRRKLDVVSVVRIFQARHATPGAVHDRSLSATLALQYGVTARAVRDIWNRRTWTNITDYL